MAPMAAPASPDDSTPVPVPDGPDDTAPVGVAGDESRAPELLGFYDRVRGRVVSFLDRKAGRVGRGTAQALLLVPDVLLLLVRLFLDRETPQATRALIGGALAYFVLPADLAPEIVLGPLGYLDDLVIAATVLGHALGPDLESRAQGYWSGSGRLYDVLRDVSRSGYELLGVDLGGRVERLVERRLLKRDPPPTSGGGSNA